MDNAKCQEESSDSAQADVGADSALDNAQTGDSDSVTFRPDDVSQRSDLYGLDRASLMQSIIYKRNKTETHDRNFDPESFEKKAEKNRLKLYKLRQERVGKTFNRKQIGLTKKDKLRNEDETLRNIRDTDF